MVDQSRLFIHFGVMTPLGVITTTVVALRFYTRLAITRLHLAADDYLILVAMFLSNGSSIMVAVADFAFDEGQALGNSRSDLEKQIGMRKIHWVATQMYPIMSFTLKISILLLYRRIFFVVPTFTRVCNVLIILISALHLAGFSSGIFLCVPISYFWEQVLPPGTPGAPTHKGRCQNYQVAWLVLGSFNVLTDLITVVLPLPVLGRLKITAQRRAFLVFIFALSSVPVIASLLRIRPLVRIPGGNDDPLFSQHVWELQLYCGIEISVGITCACLPTLTPLAVRLFPQIMGSQGANGSEPVGAFGAALGGLAKVLNGKRASDDAARHAESRGDDFDPVTTIGGTSAKLAGFKTGRKSSVGRQSGRKRSGADADIATLTADETIATKTMEIEVPVDSVEEQRSPPSPTSKQDDHHYNNSKKSKKKNALGLRLADGKSWTSKVATALTRQQHPRPQQDQQQQKSANWRLSPLPLPSPSFSLNLMLSPKTTSTPQRQAAWAARLGEVVSGTLHHQGRDEAQADEIFEDKESAFAGADASPSAPAAVPETAVEEDWDDRARPRTRPSQRRRRSSRSLDWQAASSARESAELRREAAAATAAAWGRRISAASSRDGRGQEHDDGPGQVEWWTHQQQQQHHHQQNHPHPHPLHSHPHNPNPTSPHTFFNAHPSPTSPSQSQTTSPTPSPSLPSPSIYSRASVITAYTRRPSSAMDHRRRPSAADSVASSAYPTLPHPHTYFNHSRRPSAADSVGANHLRRRPSAADAYATIEEVDVDADDVGMGRGEGDAEWAAALREVDERSEEDDDDSDGERERGRRVPAAAAAAVGQEAGDATAAAVQEKWWMALRKASNATTASSLTATGREGEGEEVEGVEDVFDRRGSVASELRRRPMSWTADLGA